MTKNNSKRTYTKEFKDSILKRLDFPTNEKNIRWNCNIVVLRKRSQAIWGMKRKDYWKKPRINTPIVIIIIVKYWFLFNLSFNHILPKITATIPSIDIKGAATIELPVNA